MALLRRHLDADGVEDFLVAKTLFGRPLYRVRCYRIGSLLIDSGCPGSAQDLVEALVDTPPEVIVLSHHHEDHVGGASGLVSRYAPKVLAPELSLERLRRASRIPMYRAFTWGQPRSVEAQGYVDGEFLDLGGIRLRALSTPGHAYDHFALFEEDRGWLFSGDLYVHERVRYTRQIEEPWEHLQSLKKMLELRPTRLYCAHAGPIEPAVEALERRIADWEDLAQAAAQGLAAGKSLRRLTREISGKEGLLSWLSFGDFSRSILLAKLAAGYGESQARV